MSAWVIAAVAAGGFLGAVARHAVSRKLNRTGRPYGTIAVNLAGAFLAGWFLEGLTAGLPQAFVVYGFLGSFTTFSTWQSEAAAMWTEGRRRKAVVYSAGLLAAGILAAALGWLMSGTGR